MIPPYYILVFDDGEEVIVIDWEDIEAELERRKAKLLHHILSGYDNALDEFVPRTYQYAIYENGEIVFKENSGALMIETLRRAMNSRDLTTAALAGHVIKRLKKEINK